MKDLLRIADLTPDDFTLLLDLAAEIKADPHRHPKLLRGELVALYFAKPSTRTRFSFEAAVTRLGGTAVSVGPADLQLSRGETIEDTARTLSHFARAFVIRTFAQADVDRFAASATIPVINALTDDHHPCQALADFLTLRERFGTLSGRTLTYVGDSNNVSNSLIEAAALCGVHVTIGCPPSHLPSGDFLARSRELATRTGGTITVTTDPAIAVEDAVAVYTDTWTSMGSGAVPERTAVALKPFQVNEALLSRAAPGAIFMHCLPAHRGNEVTAEVIDGPRSVVFDQVENRGHTEQAVLLALLERRLQGSRGC